MHPFTWPLTKYRPTASPDGEGGYTEILGEGTVVYLALERDENKLSALIEFQEDVLVGDIIADEENVQYRVIGRHRVPGTRKARLDLERVQRPISP